MEWTHRHRHDKIDMEKGGRGRGWRGSECTPRKKNTMALHGGHYDQPGRAQPNPAIPSHPILSACSQAVQAKESTGNRDLGKRSGERESLTRAQAKLTKSCGWCSAGRLQSSEVPERRRRSPDLRIANAVTIAGQRKRGERMEHQRHPSVPSIVWGRRDGCWPCWVLGWPTFSTPLLCCPTWVPREMGHGPWTTDPMD